MKSVSSTGELAAAQHLAKDAGHLAFDLWLTRLRLTMVAHIKKCKTASTVNLDIKLR